MPLSIRRVDGVAALVIDHPPVNALSRALRIALLEAIVSLAGDPTVTAIVLAASPGKFIAGADLHEMGKVPDEPTLPEVVAALDAVTKPLVAAIGGPALGGGLELAMACDLRLASPGATLGLPETRLGLLPGAGGTQRLPRLVGVARAVAMIGEAQIVGAAEALSLGIVDRLVEGDLMEAAMAAAPHAPKRRVSERDVPASDAAAEAAAEAAAIRRARGVPSVPEAVAIVRAAATTPFADGVARERAAFLRLRDGAESRALRYLFLAERQAGKIPGIQGATARPVRRVAVIGAGTMGVGIAVCLAGAGLDVVLVERDAEAARTGAARVADLLAGQVAAKRLTDDAAREQAGRIEATEEWSRLAEVDLAIEAAFEDLAVKLDIFRRLDSVAPPGAVLATNTSYLDVEAIAAATSRPQSVIGLHFFAPAHIMRLLEVVAPPATAPGVLATGLALGRRIGKLPIVAGVCDGFIGNRIFAAYRREAECILEDGASPQQIDAAMEAYGFAMGPFAVADLSGLDIAWAMRKRRAATRDPAARYVAIPDRLCEAGRFGRKVGRGWYDHVAGRAQPSPEVAALIDAERAAQGVAPRAFAAEEIQRRLLDAMAAEGARVVAEGVALRASDVDLVMVNGYGFPRWRGGPIYAARLQEV